MQYLPGNDIAVAFDLALAPLALRWRVLDEAEAQLQGWTVVTPLPGVGAFALTIPAALTALAAPALRGIRTVELEITTAFGSSIESVCLFLQGSTALAFGINTFQTHAQAMLLAQDYVVEQMPGWGASPRPSRERAMIEAFRRILLLPIGIHFNLEQSMLTADASYLVRSGPYMLRNLTPAQMRTLYEPLLAALCESQLMEAEDILSHDSIAAAQRAGLSSLTVGESSQTFRGNTVGVSQPLQLAVCARAIAPLQRWLRYGARIGRS